MARREDTRSTFLPETASQNGSQFPTLPPSYAAFTVVMTLLFVTTGFLPLATAAFCIAICSAVCASPTARHLLARVRLPAVTPTVTPDQVGVLLARSWAVGRGGCPCACPSAGGGRPSARPTSHAASAPTPRRPLIRSAASGYRVEPDHASCARRGLRMASRQAQASRRQACRALRRRRSSSIVPPLPSTVAATPTGAHMRGGVAFTQRRATLQRCHGAQTAGAVPGRCVDAKESLRGAPPPPGRPPVYCTRVSLPLEPTDASAHRAGAMRWSIQVLTFAFVSSLTCSPPSARHPPVCRNSKGAKPGTSACWGSPSPHTEDRSLCQSPLLFNEGTAEALASPNRDPEST